MMIAKKVVIFAVVVLIVLAVCGVGLKRSGFTDRRIASMLKARLYDNIEHSIVERQMYVFTIIRVRGTIPDNPSERDYGGRWWTRAFVLGGVPLILYGEGTMMYE